MICRVVALFVAVLSVAAAPPGADPALHTWFERQHSTVGDWCCSVADGHILADSEWRVSGGRYDIPMRHMSHATLVTVALLATIAVPALAQAPSSINPVTGARP